MDCLSILFMLLLVGAFIFYCTGNEDFRVGDHYFRRNFESGANMLRGDIPIYPVQQSWFNTRYGPSSFVRGWFNYY